MFECLGAHASFPLSLKLVRRSDCDKHFLRSIIAGTSSKPREDHKAAFLFAPAAGEGKIQTRSKSRPDFFRLYFAILWFIYELFAISEISLIYGGAVSKVSNLLRLKYFG